MTLRELKDKINFRKPKYALPAILYPLLLLAVYLIIDVFHTDTLEIPDENLQITEYLNAELPDAKIKGGGDGIGTKYDNMSKQYGHANDRTAVDVIEREDPNDDLEEYESRYSEEDIAILDAQEVEAAAKAREEAELRQREKEAFEELERALAEVRAQGQSTVGNVAQEDDSLLFEPPSAKRVEEKVTLEVNDPAVNALGEDDVSHAVVKKIKQSSDYFNTLGRDYEEPKLIKAIIDEDIKAVDGSRVRLRLLDDIEVGGVLLNKGTCMYATMSGFSSQRVKGSIKSILVGDELLKVSLSIYDMDGMEGLYIPSSSFRETSQDVVGGALSNTMSFNNNSSDNTFSRWGMQTLQNAYQKTSSAISKLVKKNKAKLKYGSFVYIVNSQEKRK